MSKFGPGDMARFPANRVAEIRDELYEIQRQAAQVAFSYGTNIWRAGAVCAAVRRLRERVAAGETATAVDALEDELEERDGHDGPGDDEADTEVEGFVLVGTAAAVDAPKYGGSLSPLEDSQALPIRSRFRELMRSPSRSSAPRGSFSLATTPNAHPEGGNSEFVRPNSLRPPATALKASDMRASPNSPEDSQPRLLSSHFQESMSTALPLSLPGPRSALGMAPSVPVAKRPLEPKKPRSPASPSRRSYFSPEAREARAAAYHTTRKDRVVPDIVYWKAGQRKDSGCREQ